MEKTEAAKCRLHGQFFYVAQAGNGFYMFPPLMNDFTRIMQKAANGDDHSAEAWLPLVYEELRKLAQARMTKEMASHTLQPTALVHEAWMRMVDDAERTWHNRAYFFAAASTAMRRILIDHARRKAQLKRGGGQKRISIDDLDLAEPRQDEFILLLEEALQQLEQENPKLAKIVVMKFFGGMTNDEVAEEMGISEPTVRRYWAGAKAWLVKEITSRN